MLYKIIRNELFLILSAGLAATFPFVAQQQPLPEWQSQYAVGLNKLAPHTYVWPYANASDIEKPGGYEQSPFLYESERKVEIPLGEESR